MVANVEGSFVRGLCVLAFFGVVAAFEGRIVNGTQAREGEFPFVVSLRRASSGRHSCGASLLNRAWVLTAAHCVVRSQATPGALNIQYGDHVLNPNSTKVSNISKIFVHEGYLPSNQYIHDIALLKLQTPIKFNEQLRGVRLPEAQQFTPGNTSATLIGWGLNAVSLRKVSNNGHFCAGTLLRPDWVLTAAHCFMFLKHPHELKIQYGSSKLNPEAPKFATIAKIIQHEGYNSAIAIHDIALLKLQSAIGLDQSMQLVNLVEDTKSIPAGSSKVKIVGWGLQEANGTLQQQLQQVELEIIALSDCRKKLNAFLYETNLCASGAYKGHCSGDSGGPLLLDNTQIGIVSWSLKPCATQPGVYTNVKYYTRWIRQIVGEN